MNKKAKTLLFTSIIVATGVANAAVVTVAPNASTFNQTTGSIDLEAQSNSVLLVAISAQSGSAPVLTLDPSGTPDVFNTPVVSRLEGSNNMLTSIFLVDLGTPTAGTLEFSANSMGGNQQISAFQLYNAALPAAETATAYSTDLTTGLTHTFTGLDAGSMIFAVAHSAQGQGSNGVSSASGTPSITVSDFRDRSSFLSSTVGYAYTTDVSGAPVISISGNDTTDQGSFSAVAIAPVPEPSTYALLAGLAVLGLVMVRRRFRS